MWFRGSSTTMNSIFLLILIVSFFDTHVLKLPPKNGRAERMIWRLNDSIHALPTHANLPPCFWVEALHTVAYLHNILRTKRVKLLTPTFALYQRHPTYDHLRVFGCACYPNMSTTQPHKLHHRSIRCIFLGYPSEFL